MNRCSPPASPAPLLLAAALSAALLAGCASPQVQVTVQPRTFPATAQRATLEVTYPPAVLLNGRQEIMSPGAIIRDTEGRAVLSASLAGQRLRVNYRRDTLGQLAEIWLLTPAEASLPAPGDKPFLKRLFGG